MKTPATPVALVFLAASLPAGAATTVTMNEVDKSGVGDAIGEVTVRESDYGLVFSPDLEDLPPGLHGFHVHQKPSCKARSKDGEKKAAAAAGGHYAPEDADDHGAPWGDGHRGDLPALHVDDEGKADHPVLAPRLEMDDLEGRALVIHAGGDNYADQPEPLGGGGARIACGVVG